MLVSVSGCSAPSTRCFCLQHSGEEGLCLGVPALPEVSNPKVARADHRCNNHPLRGPSTHDPEDVGEEFASASAYFAW